MPSAIRGGLLFRTMSFHLCWRILGISYWPVRLLGLTDRMQSRGCSVYLLSPDFGCLASTIISVIEKGVSTTTGSQHAVGWLRSWSNPIGRSSPIRCSLSPLQHHRNPQRSVYVHVGLWRQKAPRNWSPGYHCWLGPFLCQGLLRICSVLRNL